MKVTLKRLNQAVHFEGKNEEGLTVHMDGSPEIGGEGKGIRPMQLTLISLAGCSSIDVVIFLKKMRQELKDLEINVSAERVKDETPRVFEKIHMEYILSGKLKEEKVKKALALSIEKYCSVAKMLDKTAEITYSYIIKETA